nr:histone-lysine N-methyltransferase, H3 lysine-9 specific SUVH4 [Tanacetum cinerariifolium]
EEFKGYKFPLAVAIVCSGQYEDDEDNREEIEYTGQGGKCQIKNQEMSSANLALKNCMEQSIPVDSYQLDAGKSGFAVYKFRLKRLEGQPKLTSNK